MAIMSGKNNQWILAFISFSAQLNALNAEMQIPTSAITLFIWCAKKLTFKFHSNERDFALFIL